MSEKIKVFVGCAANNEDLESQMVFEHSLRKHASQPVQITWMQLSRDYSSVFYSVPEDDAGWRTKQWATPFSGFRWAVPLLSAERVIYFDSDFIIQADVAELWNQPFKESKAVIATNHQRLCCSMWNPREYARHCAGLMWLQGEPNSYKKMAQHFMQNPRAVQPFSNGNWNVMDVALPTDLTQPWVKAIHYTSIPTQLQFKYAMPRLLKEGGSHWFKERPQKHPRQDLQQLFDDLYTEALSKGYSIENYRTKPYGKYSIRGS